jgi:hypothetical protein
MAEPRQLAVDSAVAPAGILRGHPQHQLPDGRPGRWPTAAAGHGPAAADQIPMPAQHRVRGEEQPRPAAAANQPAQRRLHGPIGPGRPQSSDLPAQHRQLMTQDEDLRVLRRAAADQQAEQAHRPTQDQVQQSESHESAIMPHRLRQRTTRSEPTEDIVGTHRVATVGADRAPHVAPIGWATTPLGWAHDAAQPSSSRISLASARGGRAPSRFAAWPRPSIPQRR